LTLALVISGTSPAFAQLHIAQSPPDIGGSAPPNMMLALSVEFPTGVEMGYRDAAYNASKRYIGYFDPEGCYSYSAGNLPATPLTGKRTADSAKKEYFYKSGVTNNHACSGSFSGNFMNWATMQALDEFRLVMSGGDRVIDEQGMTVIQKTRHTGQSSVTRSTTNGKSVAPLNSNTVYVRVSSGELNPFSNAELSGRVIQISNDNVFRNTGSYRTYTFMGHVKVCDPNAPGGLEYDGMINGKEDIKLCKSYPNSGGTPIYKPVGLIQKYADQIRFGATGYLLDNNAGRAGGVLRARMKFVGENMIAPDEGVLPNPNREWDPQTGIYYTNPDSADAANSGVKQSGVLNYLNKFGKKNGYKSYDPLSEMFYAAQLAVRNIAPPAKFTSGITNAMKDDFPVITTTVPESGPNFKRNLPIQYACQKTHIVGIADANTHADIHVPGNTLSAGGAYSGHNGAPSDPMQFNIMSLTKKVGDLQGYNPGGNLATSRRGRDNTYFVAGLAYWANTQDMLKDDSTKPWTLGKQQAKTYFMDVQESGDGNRGQGYTHETSCAYPATTPNQMYLAAKYGGFDHKNQPESEYPNILSKSINWDRNNDCVPDNYFLGSEPEKMITGLKTVFETVAVSVTRAGRSLSAGSRSTGTQLFQASFDSGSWSGNLAAHKRDATGEAIYPAEWEAKDHIPLPGSRNIYTWNDATADGAEFTWSKLSTAQQVALGNQNILDYLRGSNAGEGTMFRSRTTAAGQRNILGDIVNSAPLYIARNEDFGHAVGSLTASYTARKANPTRTNDVVYVGANDGMLHAFDANSGKELFAYVPNDVFGNLKHLSTPGYTHRYYVDGSPAASDIQDGGVWKTVLVGSTGAGGRSYFALDVENPATFDRTNVLWEISPNVSTDFAELGVALGQASIVRLNNGVWAAVFGNGYDSAAHRAQLFIVNAKTGALIEKIDTGLGSAAAPNGLSTPLLVDINKDGTADVAYAGDLQGNLWKFDLSAASSGSWKIAFNGDPLLVARDAAGKAQPMTAKPAGVSRPAGGYMVYIGTGKFFETGDNTNLDVQTFYGVLDNGASTLGRANLQAQTLTLSATTGYRTSTANTVNYATQSGFYLDLKIGNKQEGERLLAPPLLTKKTLIISSLAPDTSANVCENGNSSSWLTELSLFDGSKPAISIFGQSGNSMRIEGGGGGAIGQIGRYGYISVKPGQDGILKIKLPGGRIGRQSWRQLR
jgi:type IV pilus assembly protein PilY1